MPYVGKKPADIIATAVDTTTGTFSGDLTVDTSTLYVDSANNRVGVGTVSPASVIHAVGSITVATIESTAANGDIQIKGSGTTGYTALRANAENLVFLTNTAEAMRIDSSGNVGIGTSSPNGNGLLTINSPTNISPQIVFSENNTAKWLIGHRHDGDHFRFYDLANSAERMRIDSSGNVGIGTSSPAFTLEVNKGSAGDIARFTDGVNANTVIKTSGSVTTFGPDTNNSLALQTNNLERMRIDASGNVGINESNPSSSLHIYGSDPKITLEHSNENGTAQIYTTAQSAIILDADPTNTDNGTPIQFRIDGNEVGRFDSGGRLITPYGVTLGTSAGTYSAGNTLDDYEEGTWTATLEGSTTNPNTPVTLSSARYTKIGRQVMVQGQFSNVDTTGAAGGVRVKGLPFTASTAFASGNVMTYVRFTLQTNSTNISPYATGNEIAFYQSTNGAGWGEIAHSAGTGAYLAWTAIYDTNA